MDLRSTKYFRFIKKDRSLLILTSLYVVVVTSSLPYGLVPSFLIALLTLLCVFLIAYPVHSFFLPRYINRSQKKKWHILGYLFISLLLIAVVQYFIAKCSSILFDYFDVTNPDEWLGSKYLFTCIITYLFCHIVYFRKKTVDAIEREDKLQLEKKELEMQVLKSQINSHFLFNALNNIYSMAYFNKKETPQYVIKLSQMLRYVLEECETDLVPLSKEIQYVENYLDFQKARFDGSKNIQFKLTMNDSGDVLVPPMIFQPVIENCFKYCTFNSDKDFVSIELIVDKHQIKFITENSKLLLKQINRDRKKSIGINNFKRRLSLAYPGGYTHNIMDGNQTYRSEIVITLK